jgi:hypothetical protein
MMGGKRKKGGEGGRGEQRVERLKTRSERRGRSGVGKFMSSCESESGQLRQHSRATVFGREEKNTGRIV